MTTTRVQDTGALDVAELVRRAAAGESWAWERLIDQYSRLIWAITRDFKLVESDAADVAQVTWLRLLENIHKIENPDRVGSWLASTARNECLRCLSNRKRVVLAEDEEVLQSGATPEPEVDAGLLLAERSEMVREAMARLPWRWQCMLDMLMADPPASYAEISDQLGLPIGSIGPTRSRCLARLRSLLHSSLFSGLSIIDRIFGACNCTRALRISGLPVGILKVVLWLQRTAGGREDCGKPKRFRDKSRNTSRRDKCRAGRECLSCLRLRRLSRGA